MSTAAIETPGSPLSLNAAPSESLPGILVKSASAPNVRIPKFLDAARLLRKYHNAPSTGNLHGLRSVDYSRVNWPLPHMFGEENYSYGVIDIEDHRYKLEAGGMSHKLIKLFYEQQLIDLEWRKAYKSLLHKEYLRATVSATTAEKVKTKMEKDIANSTDYLLRLQDQRDFYDTHFQNIWDRCSDIKLKLSEERSLEELGQETTMRTREKFPIDHQFWKTRFNVKSKYPSTPGNADPKQQKTKLPSIANRY